MIKASLFDWNGVFASGLSTVFVLDWKDCEGIRQFMYFKSQEEAMVYAIASGFEIVKTEIRYSEPFDPS